MAAKPTEEEITRFANMFSAMGAGPRLRIMRVLLSAHPDGMVVNEIGSELGYQRLRFHTISKNSKMRAWLR